MITKMLKTDQKKLSASMACTDISKGRSQGIKRHMKCTFWLPRGQLIIKLKGKLVWFTSQKGNMACVLAPKKAFKYKFGS